MSTPKLIGIAQQALRQIRQAAKTFTKGFVTGLLRGLLVLGRQPLTARSGFVLPTTVLLLLVLTLTVGSIGFRTYTRTQQTIGERQQRVIFNAATPAIDRARAKLEFLFDSNRDPRLPAGIPSETQMLGMLYNDNRPVPPDNVRVPRYNPNGTDPYTFTDEARINIGDDGLPDNAWRYRTDTNGDGQLDATVVYSILLRTPQIQANGDNPLVRADQQSIRDRASTLMVRHGPLSNTVQQNENCATVGSANPQAGWFPDPLKTTVLRKNFQVNAYVLPDAANGTVSTLEFHQDRFVTLGNRWGAWFRNDLEIFPGPAFNWNGAMHTEGNLVTGNNAFTAYMISSPRSCLYTKDASIITVTEIDANPAEGIPAFEGQFLSGKLGDNPGFSDENRFHLFTEANVAPISDANDNRVKFNPNTDSVINTGTPVEYALDPVVLQTKDQSKARGNVPANARSATWDAGEFRKRDRMYNEFQEKPFVDDFFRADNRYGPKPTYGNVPVPDVIGEEIPASQATLVRNEPLTPDDPSNLGQDGYWERRARYEGMRVIVGQRLELGDPAGWGGPIQSRSLNREPLKPWRRCPVNAVNPNRCNEARQRRTLWDNLAAVQATVVYHTAANPNNPDYPAACLATTVHPGTAATLENSSTFENLIYSSLDVRQPLEPSFRGPGFSPAYSLVDDFGNPLEWTSDFFRGRGTNGWEYALPSENNFRNLGSPLMVALKNLANFAGDPNGGAPSFTPVTQDGVVHPYPSMAQWGDFSMLRRVIGLMENGTSYDRLSPSDKTVLHSAGCTIGMLAHNVDLLERFDVERLLDRTLNPTNYRKFRMLIGFKLSETQSGNPVFVDFCAQFNACSGNALRLEEMRGMGLRGYLRRINNPTAYKGHFVTSRQGSAAPVPGIATMLGDLTGADNPESFVRMLERWRDRLENSNFNSSPQANIIKAAYAQGTFQNAKDEFNQLIYLSQLIITKEQVARDRKYGFFGSGNTYGNQVYGDAPLGRCTQWRGGIRPDGSSTADPGRDEEPLGLLCSARPRYPILFSLFPALDNQAPYAFRGTNFNALDAYDSTGINYNNFEPHGELPEIARDSDDSSDNYILGANSDPQAYKVVRPGDIALRPKDRNQGGWVIPTQSATTAFATPSNNRDTLIKVCDQPCTTASSGEAVPATNPPQYGPYNAARVLRIPFKDTVPFNGREMMVSRMLDLNLGFLRDSTIGSDRWLPNSGIIYAFREDAVSEPQINRPARASWSTCNTAAGILSAGCRMLTDTFDAFLSKDPPLNSDNLISPKPVDFYADPDRRPFGFRIRNGKTINRPNDNGRGLSLISDNPVYIQGDFNCHIANAGDDCQNGRIEEFIQRLPPDFNPNDFYGRRDPDVRFAKIENDLWRPSEILADAISIVSNNFCDGSIDDGFQNIGRGGGSTIPFRDGANSNDYGCQGNNNRTSYLNQNLPSPGFTVAGTPFIWARANPADTLGFEFTGANAPDATQRKAASVSPVFINRDGNPMVMASANSFTDYGAPGQTFETFASGKSLITAAQTRVNAIIISGIVPSRQFQSYGGLHNFPRFLETWGNNQLFIAGAFLQLNFSTHGTGPFDQDAWSPGENPANGENIRYYSPPPRRWGYDVGLQYAPAGPIARRFASPPQASRSEFYTEPAANDPYIVNLCRQVSASCPPPA
jgi:hypothetical protein